MKEIQEKTIKDDQIEKYVSLSKALEILAINIPLVSKNNKRDARAILVNLKIRDKRINGETFYHIDDIYNTLDLVRNFFNDYYVTEEISIIPKIIRAKISNVKIPSGYNYVSYNKRFPNKPYKIFTLGYKKSEADKYIRHKKADENMYMPLIEAMEILQAKNDVTSESGRKNVIKNFIKLGIETKFINNKTYCKIDHVYNTLNTVRKFFDEHYVSDEIPLSNMVIKILTQKGMLLTVKIPNAYNAVLVKERFDDKPYKTFVLAYNKSEADHYIQLYKSSKQEIAHNDYNYLKIEDVIILTKYRVNYFLTKIIPTYNISTYLSGNQSMFLKSDIDDLLIKQKEFFQEYIDTKTACETYKNDIKTYYFKHLKTYTAPPFAYTKDVFFSITSKKGVYKISEINELICKKNIIRIDSNIKGETPFDTFNIRLNHFIPWSGFDKKSKYTENKWFEYVKNVLMNINFKGNALNTAINWYVKCTQLVKDMLEKNNKMEVYMLTAPEINLYKRTIDSGNKEKVIYKFIKAVYEDILITTNKVKQIYRISDIEPPIKRKRKRKIDENYADIIYDFKVYSSVFQYMLKTDFHAKKSIKEIENRGTCIYASTWLYTMLHLNNAWRHGDVRDFPKIEISDILDRLNIDDIEWFKINKITLPQAREIIERIRQWEFIISKTEMKGRFFCSDELALPLATCIIILTLFGHKYTINSLDVLMNFNTKYNDVSKSQLKKFFNIKSLNNFSFSSRKFNKTVMTYITYLANMSGDKKAIEYAKWIRSHVNIDSTLHYIDFNIQAVEELSKMLFARGEFGYVSSLLLKRLNKGDIKDFREITEQIYSLNKMFGDATKLNSTVGFLNTIRSERASVAKYITQLSLKECQEKLTDLFARKLPSKDGEDIQCLFSKTKCQKQNLDSCFECPFHIPTIYALSSLCDSIKHDFERYKINPCQVNKIKMAIKIHRKKLVFAEAINRFGEEYVMGCLGMTLDDFIDQLSEIPNPMQLK